MKNIPKGLNDIVVPVLPRDLSHFKKILRERRISQQVVADYIGHSRENVTLWLNGKGSPPERTVKHVSEEIMELIKNLNHKPSS